MPWTSRRTALTLLELAAVVAALAVLAAMLTPALGDVRRRGKDTVCLQNLARIAQASTVYAGQDLDGQAVPVHFMYTFGPAWGHPSSSTRATLSICYGGKSGKGEHGNRLFWGTAFGRGPTSRPLNAILYKRDFPDYMAEPYGSYPYADILQRWYADETLDLAVYRCPSDSVYSGLGPHGLELSGSSAFDHYGNSYNASDMWVGIGPDYPLSSNTPLLHRLYELANPAETIWYTENCARHAKHVAPFPDDCSLGEQYATIRGWHGEDFRFNVSFVDGHADYIRIRGFDNPILGHYPGYTDPWSGFVHWKCVTMRGPGWQIDTLPVAPVETDLIWEKSGADQAAEDCGDCPARMIPEADLVAAAPGRHAPEPAGATGSDVEG